MTRRRGKSWLGRAGPCARPLQGVGTKQNGGRQAPALPTPDEILPKSPCLTSLFPAASLIRSPPRGVLIFFIPLALTREISFKCPSTSPPLALRQATLSSRARRGICFSVPPTAPAIACLHPDPPHRVPNQPCHSEPLIPLGARDLLFARPATPGIAYLPHPFSTPCPQSTCHPEPLIPLGARDLLFARPATPGIAYLPHLFSTGCLRFLRFSRFLRFLRIYLAETKGRKNPTRTGTGAANPSLTLSLSAGTLRLPAAAPFRTPRRRPRRAAVRSGPG